MKKLFIYSFLFITVSFFLFSCSKKDAQSSATTATYYIKGKKDGVAFNFTANAMAKVTDFGSGFKALNLLANGSAMEGFNLGINFFNGTTIQAGSYSEDNAGTDFAVGGVYNPNSTTTVNAAGIQSPTVRPLVINILTKTNTEVTGTFEGAFYRQDVTTGALYTDYILITEGEFKLLLQ